MSEIKLFKFGEVVTEVSPLGPTFTTGLQNLVETNMKKLFGVNFIANNYQVGRGSIHAVGLDENKCPVVFVYIKDDDKSFLSKGLFFIEQLLASKDRFTVSVSSKLGKKYAENIDWSMPRAICISIGYNKYDRSAVNQVSRNIALIQFNQYGDDILMFELVESNVSTPLEETGKLRNSWTANYKKTSPEIKALYERMNEYALYLGEAVTINQLRNYVAYKKIKNFAAVRIENNKILLNLNLDASKYVERGEAYKDVSYLVKYGTGQLQYTFSTEEGYQEAKKLLLEAYNKN